MELKVTVSKESLNEIAQMAVDMIEKKQSKERTISKREIIPKPEEFQYTVAEVAEMSKQKTGTVTRHIRLGLIKASKVGKSWKISQENYQNYINNKPSE